MASLAFLFGIIPATEKVEAADDKIRADFAAYKEFEQSDELKHFQELENEVKSNDFVENKKKILKEKYKASNEYKKEKEYKRLSKKTKKKDEQPEELISLQKEIESDAFKTRVNYLKMKPKERYESTEEYKKEKEYAQLKSSEKIVWYFKTQKKYPFNEIEQWEETFNESFESGKLDDKWMNRYYWGDQILDEPYTMADDKSFPTDGNNIEFLDKKLRIVTRKEEIEGKKWDPFHGFLNDTFDFTSGLINTGKGFRQKYGIFKAKIKIASADMTQAFWMVSDGIVPHIDVAKYERGKLYSGFFYNAGEKNNILKSITKTGGSKFTNDFYIFSLEWYPEKLVWKINDKVFKTLKVNVPQDEMYMVFSAGLKEWANESGFPAAMEIDWVRVYKKKE